MTNSETIAFYHSADLDGHCSGAIAFRALPGADLRPYDYGEPFPWDDVPGRHVVMIDVSLQPFSDMERLCRLCSLTWIDHHKSAIDEAISSSDFRANGAREIGKAACELAWEYFFPAMPMPRAVRLLGRYDVWDHSDDDTMPFQFGIRTMEARIDAKGR